MGGVDVHIYVQGSDPLADTPVIWVVYSHDPDQVTIHAIHVVHQRTPERLCRAKYRFRRSTPPP